MTNKDLIIGGAITTVSLLWYYYTYINVANEDEDDYELLCSDFKAISCGTNGSINFIQAGSSLTSDYIKIDQACCENLGYNWGSINGGKNGCKCPSKGL